MSGEHYLNIAPMTDTADLFVKIGWCPDVVKLINLYDGQEFYWNRCEHGHYQGAASSGGIEVGTTGGRNLTLVKGVKLVKFVNSNILDVSSDPADVDSTNWPDANGIKISANVALLTTDKMVQIEAWRMDFIWLKAYHDGTTSSNTYFEDTSYDFIELGVCGNGQWLIYNQTNGNYAYVKDVLKGSGSNHSRIYTAIDAAGTATTAADFDTSDVCYLFPVAAASYPLSDVALMT